MTPSSNFSLLKIQASNCKGTNSKYQQMCLRDTKAAEDLELIHTSQVTKSFQSAACCSDKLRQDNELMRSMSPSSNKQSCSPQNLDEKEQNCNNIHEV